MAPKPPKAKRELPGSGIMSVSGGAPNPGELDTLYETILRRMVENGEWERSTSINIAWNF